MRRVPTLGIDESTPPKIQAASTKADANKAPIIHIVLDDAR